jgi:hypothetical protein
MGSSKAPDYEDPKVTQMEGGREAFDYAMNMMKKGLPEEMKREYERKFTGDISGQVRGADQMLKEKFSSMGNVPVGAMNDAFTKVRSGANEATANFRGDMVEKDFGAKQAGFGNFTSLQGIAQALANAKNQYKLGKHQIDEEGKFSFGNMLGSVVGAAGNVGAGAASAGACCFIFLEALNGILPWWVRACRDEFAEESTARREGYIRMSEWLVPLMASPQPLSTWRGALLKRIVRALVNTLMIKPLMKWGGWYKNVPGYKRYWYYKPVVMLWFKFWEVYGYQPHPNPSPPACGTGRKERGIIQYGV